MKTAIRIPGKMYPAKLHPIFLIAFLIAAAVPAFSREAEAMFLSSTPRQDAVGPTQSSGGRAADMATIQKDLESRIVRQKLLDLGLSTEEAMARVNQLSDDQLHQFASRLDSLQAGGHHEDSLIVILLLLILIVLIV